MFAAFPNIRVFYPLEVSCEEGLVAKSRGVYLRSRIYNIIFLLLFPHKHSLPQDKGVERKRLSPCFA